MEIKGFTYGYGAKRGDLASEAAAESQKLLFETGVNWICITVVVEQKTFSSTEIMFDFKRTATDKEITETIIRARENGINVCLKPIINCSDGVWRALIDFPDWDMWGNDHYWDQWFESYGAFLTHYAEIARDTNCEMFCVGCEMSGTERKEAHWRKLIESVKEIYSGSVVYNTNHGNEEKIKWFDAIDYIGTSAYYPLAKKPGDSKDTMTQSWMKVSERLEELSEKFGKQVIFMEVGCRSARGLYNQKFDAAIFASNSR